MQNMKTSRNSLTINPLEEYSITSPTVVPINTLVKQGNYGFVGGDTEYTSYDFGLKVASSSVECPMKIYYANSSTLLIPGGAWTEEVTQANLDKIKTQDGTSYTINTTTSGNTIQAVIELDLTPLCNALFGGSNSALKSALKSIQVDCWASGYGSNGGVQTYGVNVNTFSFSLNTWLNSGNGTQGSSWQTSSSSSITKLSINKASSPNDLVQSNNKINILVASQYASDGTIASSVSLDYINIGIQLNRTPDVINPINVNVPKYWAMLVKGLSPIYSSLDTLSSHAGIFDLNNGTATNRFVLYIDKTTKNISFIENINSNST
ncbi:MAG: hypothetical protein Q8936_25390, partial [Bacillota bacterium]|nr:hypothetical protein [Bacillota bacterium]